MNLLDLTGEPTPKKLGNRILNFIIIVLLLMLAPIFIAVASAVNVIWQQVLSIIVMIIAYSAVGYYAYRLLKKTANQPVFHRIDIRNWRHIWYIIGMFILMMVVQGVIINLRVAITGTSTTENQAAIEELTKHINVAMIGTMIYGVLLAPVVEELIFRGLVINYFFRQSWWWASIILSGFLFAVPHTMNLSTNIADLLAFMIYMSMGMVLAYVYKKTGDIQSNIMIHFLNNLISMIPLLFLALSRI